MIAQMNSIDVNTIITTTSLELEGFNIYNIEEIQLLNQIEDQMNILN